jgi:hypothetical protein
MAKIKIEAILDKLDYEMRRALKATLEEHFPDSDFDTRAIFRTFKKQVYRKCSTWERVPDNLVEKDNN